MIWNVDDLMASCVVDFELTKLSCFTNIYGTKLTMQMGNTPHNYLGVEDLEFQ